MMTRVAEQPLMYSSQMQQQYYQFPNNQYNSLPPPTLSQSQYTIPNQTNFNSIPSHINTSQTSQSSVQSNPALSPNTASPGQSNDFNQNGNINPNSQSNAVSQQNQIVQNPQNSQSQTNLNSPIQPNTQQQGLISQYQQNGLVYYAYNQYPNATTPTYNPNQEFFNNPNQQQNMMNSINQVSLDNKFNMNGLFSSTNATSLSSNLQFNNSNTLLDMKQDLPQQQPLNNSFSNMDTQNNQFTPGMLHPRTVSYSNDQARHLSLPVGQNGMNMAHGLVQAGSPKDDYFNNQKRYKRRRHTDGYTVNDMTPETAARNRCQRCQKQFKRPSSLQTHLYSHTGEKPFACTWDNCGRLFSVKSNMTRHMKLHERDAKLNKSEQDQQSPQQDHDHSNTISDNVNINDNHSTSNHILHQNNNHAIGVTQII